VSDVEARLRFALAPVEPPEARLTDRLERTLTDISDAAADELAEWELRAMRDPRNWIRPAAAAAAGGLAGGALILLRVRQRQRVRSQGAVRSLDRRTRAATDALRRQLRR
jgi:hypothetical protein